MPSSVISEKSKKDDHDGEFEIPSDVDTTILILEAKLNRYVKIVQEIFENIGPCNIDRTKRYTFLAKAATLDVVHKQFSEALDELERLKTNSQENYEPSFQEVDEFMVMYGQIKYWEKKFESSSTRDTSDSVRIEQPRLPPLDLPSFNGDINDWPSFYETFKNLIHNNKSLSSDQKVQYLVSKLKDQALAVCAGLPPVGPNYEIIWKSLVDRYQDVRYLASHYVDTILNFKPISQECKVSYNHFVDSLGASVIALQALNIENLAEYILYAISIKKLDRDVARQFETKSIVHETLPKFSDLLQFVKDYVRVLERTDSTPTLTKKPLGSNPTPVKKWQSKAVSFHSSQKKCDQCPICEGSHLIYQCHKFNKMDPHTRHEKIKSLKLCFNCFSASHNSMSCSSSKSCQICRHNHHTLLHLKSYQPPAPSNKPSSPPKFSTPHAAIHEPRQPSVSNHTVTASAVSNPKQKYTVLLSTVKVNVFDTDGNLHTLRMLLDSGSMSHFITAKCRKMLGIPCHKVSASVGGIGSTKSEVKGVTAFTIQSRFDASKRYIIDHAFVVDKITNKLPVCPIDAKGLFSILRHANLSDDEFDKPGDIHGLIGAELFSQVYGAPKFNAADGPVIIETHLGDIIMGKVPVYSSEGNESTVCNFVETPLESLVQRFWALEEVPTPVSLCSEDKECEELFSKTYSRREDGRYSVSIPFKSDSTLLGESYPIAEKRFLNTEKKLSKTPELKEQYNAAITAYMKDGFAVPSVYKPHETQYFMPHHAIFRPEKKTSKVRVVFDLSCSTSNGISLNDLLHTGPTLYNDLFELLLKFRMFPVACTADIKKMFLQIYVHEDDRKFQKFLWRDSPQDKLQCFEMERVVFGSKPSPFLAQRALHQLADDEKLKYPAAEEEIKRNFYMDDYLNSFLDDEQAVSTYSQCSDALKSGGFELTKLASNSPVLLKSVPEEDRLLTRVEWDTNSSLKVLGTQYCPAEDKFLFQVKIQDPKCTKRNILSTTAHIFDVLGLVSPVTICTKILIKELWLLKIDWDEAPPPSIQERWNQIIQELPLLNELHIPRHLLIERDCEVNLIGFCDASEKAMGCNIYVQVIAPNGKINSRLLCARSKVCPVRYVTIPRLELCAMLLLSKLMAYVQSVFKSRCNVKHVLCFSDSTVALAWIASQPLRWKTFVANRVTQIQDHVPPERWFHVQGIENPADCLSRGVLPSELIAHPLWLQGPLWLSTPIHSWNLIHVNENEADIPEEKVTVLLTSKEQAKEFVLLEMSSKFSHWNKYLRAVVYVLKFALVLPKGDITVQDMEKAEERILKELQAFAFAKDIDNLTNNKECSNAMLKLRPFMENGLLRCGGRLSNAADLAYEQIHPIILPKTHHVVNLLIDYYHHKNYHTGPQLVISILRQRYWILGCRDVVRRRLQKCNVCFKRSPKPLYPVMGDLPSPRVDVPTKAFMHTGVDYAGPLNITISKRRGVRSQKSYLVLFVCLSSRAIHIELASDLSTPTFILALRRFIARRGAIKSIYSDQGTNFIGSANILGELYGFLSSPDYQNDFKEELLKQRIEFHFNPPASPHHGGLWESNIRQVKNHLFKAIGSQILTFEEMSTLLAEIESILNSRPLCVSTDSSDPVVLTPAHFLMQHPHVSLTHHPNFQSRSLSVRYKLLTQLLDSFWKRWSQEYLSTLQSRNKWYQDARDQLQMDMLVLIKSDNAPVSCWPLGRVIRLFPGKDAVSRVALIETKTGIYKRPAVKLCPLPTQ